MKKILSFIIVIIIFLVGIKIGSNTTFSSSKEDLFENAKEDFESQIIIPNNEYQNIELKPVEYLPNKIASIISKILEKITNKIA